MTTKGKIITTGILTVAAIAVTTATCVYIYKADHKAQKEKPNKPVTPVTPATKEETIAKGKEALKTEANKNFDEAKNAETNTTKQDLIAKYSKENAEKLANNKEDLLNAVKDLIDNDGLEKTGKFYDDVALALNNVLASILKDEVTTPQPSKNGKEIVKEHLSEAKLNEIKDQIADILTNHADAIVAVGQQIFHSLKNTESTKNIAVLDNFIKEMVKFFKEEIPNVANEAKKQKINAKNGIQKGLEALKKTMMDDLKAKAAKKAHELLPDPKDYNAIRDVLKPKYEQLETKIYDNFQLLATRTLALGTLIDDLHQ